MVEEGAAIQSWRLHENNTARSWRAEVVQFEASKGENAVVPAKGSKLTSRIDMQDVEQ